MLQLVKYHSKENAGNVSVGNVHLYLLCHFVFSFVKILYRIQINENVDKYVVFCIFGYSQKGFFEYVALLQRDRFRTA